MKTNTRKYKLKNRKTKNKRGGGQVKAPETKVEAPVIAVPVTTVPEQKSFWGSIFGSASKPGDKIVKAVKELITLANPKMGDITNKTLKTIIEDANKLQ
jgi:hypothetical protein